MPMILNEPLSFLQRLVEYMEYVDLFEKASEESDPVNRMQLNNAPGGSTWPGYYKATDDFAMKIVWKDNALEADIYYDAEAQSAKDFFTSQITPQFLAGFDPCTVIKLGLYPCSTKTSNADKYHTCVLNPTGNNGPDQAKFLNCNFSGKNPDECAKECKMDPDGINKCVKEKAATQCSSYKQAFEAIAKNPSQAEVDNAKYVAAFAVSAVSCNWERIGKPFNPLLGETYELERDSFRVICEQVSHHPPISAFHAENDIFSFHGSIYPKPKLWGKNIEIQPEGIVTAELKKWDEAYTWSNVTCSVHNVVVGKIWIEQSGTMEITNHKTGHRAVLNFKSSGWFSKDVNRVEGFVFDRSKKKMKFLYGRWSDHMKATDMFSFEEFVKDNCHRYKIGDGKNSNDTSPTPNTPKRVLSKFNSFKMGSSMFKSMSQAERDDIDDENGDIDESKPDSPFVIDIPNSVTLWEVNPRIEKSLNDSENNGSYHFSEFTKSLNKLDSDMIGRICPTDSRFRPDIRKLEMNDIEGAASEKNRLEEKQRDVRSLRKRKKIPDWNPRWFYLKTNPYTNQEDWYYNGKYWDRNFHSDPDIF